MTSTASTTGDSGTAYTARDVLLFWPNLIGYARVACASSGLVLMVLASEDPSSFGRAWPLALMLYVVGFAGDLFDGLAARRFGQMSEYGGLLDMVTDRCSTAGLLYVLDGEYTATWNHDVFVAPGRRATYRLLFLFLIILDISSHWCQMFSSATQREHHKSSTANAKHFFLVRWYYGSYPFFSYCCVGAEFTYIALYATRRLAMEEDPDALLVRATSTLARAVLAVCVPACIVKQVVNVSQLCSACNVVASRDADERNEKRER